MGIRDVVADAIERGPRMALGHLIRGSSVGDKVRRYPRWSQGSPQYLDWNIRNAALEGYESNLVANRCIRTLAQGFQSVPWQVKVKQGDGWAVSLQHEANAWLEEPTPAGKGVFSLSFQDIMFRYVVMRRIAGNTYWYALEGDHIYTIPLRSDRIEITPKAGNELSYKYTVGDDYETYEMADIIHSLEYDPIKDFYGIAMMRVAGRTIDTANAIQDGQKSSLQNMVIPSGLISGNCETDEQYENLLDQLEGQKQGPKNLRKVLIASTDMHFDPFSMTPVELDLIQSAGFSNAMTCAGFGVHPYLIGLAEAKYENQKQAELFMWEHEIIPEINYTGGMLNMQLRPHFKDTDFRFVPDLSRTPPVVERRRKNADESKIYFGMGMSPRAINECLGLGFDPDECADTGYIDMRLVPVGTSVGLSSARSLRSIDFTDDQMAAAWRTVDLGKQGWVRSVGEQVRERFAAEMGVVSAVVKSGVTDTDPTIDAQRDAWNDFLLTAWRNVIEDFGDQIFEGLDQGLPEIGSGRRSGSEGPLVRSGLWDAWSAFVQGFVERQVAKDIGHILDTTKRATRRAILAGMESGESTSEIAKRVRTVYGDWQGKGELPLDRSRSFLIARTEVHTAAGFGQHEAAKQTKVLNEKHWLDAGDGEVRDSHSRATAEGWIPIDQAYSNGLMYTGDPSMGVHETANCRCTDMYRTGG